MASKKEALPKSKEDTNSIKNKFFKGSAFCRAFLFLGNFNNFEMGLLDIYLASGRSVTTDTRKINKGDMFFALKGANFNANLFVLDALEKGASWVVVDEDHGFSHDHIIRVDDVLKALQQLAHDYRKHLSIPVLALTGSNGKTTTKELLACVLANKFDLNYTEGNLNNEIGVPLTILKTKADQDFLLVEMGANHQGEIQALSEIACPDFGLITNIGKAHLEGFGGLEGVKKGKSELYRHLSSNKGKIFLNQSDEVLKTLLPSDADVIQYDSSDFKILAKDPFLKVAYDGTEISSNLTGEFNVNNIAVAVAVGRYFQISMEQITSSINSYFPNNNRSQLVTWNGISIIMDAYNANPSSVESSVTSFLKSEAGKKVVILGDMFELGDFAHSEHERMIQLVLSLQPSQCFFIGKNYHLFKGSYDGVFYASTEEAKNEIRFDEFSGKKLLIKGSRGMALEKLIQ